MSKQRYEGRTAAEAAIRACEALGLTRGELRHTVISDEGEMLSRRVVIEVEAPKARAVAPAPPAPRQELRPAPSRAAAAPAPARADAAQADDEGGNEARSERPSRARRPRGERRPRNGEAQAANADIPAEGEAAPAPERAAPAPRRPRADRPRPSAGVAPDSSAEVPAVVDEAGGTSEASAATGERGRSRSRSRGRGGRSRGERQDRPEGAGRSGEAVPAPSVVPRDDDADAVAPPPYAAAPAPAYAEERAPAAAPAAPSGRSGGRRGPRGNDAGRGAQGGVDSLLAMRPADDFADLEVKKLAAIAPVSERSKRVCDMVTELVDLMGFDLESRLVSENEAEVHVHLHGPSEQDAVGDKGEVLLSLQFAINRMLSRHEDEGEQVLVLDAGGYRQRRQLAIEALARDLAERALAHNKAVRLSPMSAHDRRIFHLALKDFEGIATQSEGDGVFRNLLIVPSAFL